MNALARTAVSIVPKKNARRVMLIAWENGNVSVIADRPMAKKYQRGAWPPPPYLGASPGIIA